MFIDQPLIISIQNVLLGMEPDGAIPIWVVRNIYVKNVVPLLKSQHLLINLLMAIEAVPKPVVFVADNIGEYVPRM